MNVYSLFTERLRDALSSGLAQYPGLVVKRQEFRPPALPPFTRYCLIIAPTERPWDEDMSIGIRQVRDVLRCNLFALVKNFDDEETAIWSTTAGSLGLFELVTDVKELIRTSTLDGLIEKTYAEIAGDPRQGGAGGVQYGRSADPGFETGDYAFVYRALLPVAVRIRDIRCFPVVT